MKMLGIIAVGVIRESRKFSGHHMYEGRSISSENQYITLINFSQVICQ